MIKKRKNLIEFLKWFESRKNREMDPYREFCEELIEPGLLPKDAFKHIKYVFIGKHIEGVLKSPVYPDDELRYADIFELRPENDIQRKAISDLQNNETEILFATPEEIRKRASNKRDVILPPIQVPKKAKGKRAEKLKADFPFPVQYINQWHRIKQEKTKYSTCINQ